MKYVAPTLFIGIGFNFIYAIGNAPWYLFFNSLVTLITITGMYYYDYKTWQAKEIFHEIFKNRLKSTEFFKDD